MGSNRGFLSAGRNSAFGGKSNSTSHPLQSEQRCPYNLVHGLTPLDNYTTIDGHHILFFYI